MTNQHLATQPYNHLHPQKFSHADPSMDCMTSQAGIPALSSDLPPVAIRFDREDKRPANSPAFVPSLLDALDDA
jgi:hypothetical protein